jgi:hypothetical protein
VKRIGSKSAPSPTNAISAEDAIDVVIAWVDGRDPQHRRKRQRYLADPGADEQPEQVASKERRFSDNDEIRFCLRSIRNYAPWVRSIWLVTDNQVPASIDRQQAELDNIHIVDHREIFRGHEQLLPTFNSFAIESMLWRIDGLADRFLYFNDDMMLVSPVESTDFFSNEGKVNLRGRWNNLDGKREEEISFFDGTKVRGAEMLGYTSEHFFSPDHAIYPMLRPAMEELFEEFQAAFLSNAAYRFRSRKQFWPISTHNHLLLKTSRARVEKPQRSAHFSNRYCLTASPEALEARLKQLSDGTMRMVCINHLEAVVDKVPDAMHYLSEATGRQRRSKSSGVERTHHACDQSRVLSRSLGDWRSAEPAVSGTAYAARHFAASLSGVHRHDEVRGPRTPWPIGLQRWRRRANSSMKHPSAHSSSASATFSSRNRMAVPGSPTRPRSTAPRTRHSKSGR